MIASSLAAPQILPIRQPPIRHPPIPPEKESTRDSAFSGVSGNAFSGRLDATRQNQQAKQKADADLRTNDPDARALRNRESGASAPDPAKETDASKLQRPSATRPGSTVGKTDVERQPVADAPADADLLAAAAAAKTELDGTQVAVADATQAADRKSLKEADAVDPSRWAALLTQPTVPPAESQAVPWASTEPPVVSDEPDSGLDTSKSAAGSQATAADVVDAAKARPSRTARGAQKTDASGTDRQALMAYLNPTSATAPQGPAPGADSADARGDTLPLGAFGAAFSSGRMPVDGGNKPAFDDRLAAATAAAAGPSPTGLVGDTAAPASALASRLAAAPGTPEFATQLGTTLTTFARQGVEHAKLELNPAEMGPLTIQIKIEGVRALVHLAAEHEQTRQALEQSMPQLAGSLREAGLTLSGGGVSEQAPRQPPLPADWEQQGERERSARGIRLAAGDEGDGGGLGRIDIAGSAQRIARRGVVDLVA